MTTNEPVVLTERDGPVFIVSINRPKAKNAVNFATANALVNAFETFEKDESLKVAVLTGNGGTFCAGFDLKELSNTKDTYQSNVKIEDIVKPVGKGPGPMGPSRMVFTKPTIAAVSGYAVAGGLELACLCDMRVVEEDATMGVFCRRWGVPLIDGGTVRLPRMIGLSRALDLILTGRPVDAKEALQFGLANRVVKKGESKAEAIKLAKEIASFPEECMKLDRKSAYEQFDLNFMDAMTNEFNLGSTVLKKESVQGASKFSSGSGRHGSFSEFKSKL